MPDSQQTGNVLYYGDNLDILRRYIPDESVDLVYLDPPFKSNQDYNILFAEKNGSQSAAQIKVFEDTWHWDQSAAEACKEVVESGGKAAQAIIAFRAFLGENDMMAYLAMMAPRLVELRRVLKPTGSIYLHCDPTASHYLKILLDAVFGHANFKNEISWQRTTTKGDYRQGATNWPRIRDALLYYARDETTVIFHQPFAPYSREYIASHYGQRDSDGRRFMLDNLTAPGAGTRGHPTYEFLGVTRYWRYNKDKMSDLLNQGRVIQPKPGAVPRYKRYLDEMPGIAIGDSWEDIYPINSQAQERLGYPTQKPIALLERIISASSNPGDLVLDPFCGCGTTIVAAQKLGRRWIGIDITHLAVTLMKHRLKDIFGDGISYEVIGEPVDIKGGESLAKEDPYQFQWWALGLVNARPVEQKKGADKGIDGRLYFHDEGATGQTKQIIFSVKAGKTMPAHVMELRGVVERENAAIGVLISFEEPTRNMRKEAASAGFYHSSGWNKDYPKLQLITVQELLEGKKIDYPPSKEVDVTYKKAPKATPAKKAKNKDLFTE